MRPETISRGNLNYRINDISNDELGDIAVVVQPDGCRP